MQVHFAPKASPAEANHRIQRIAASSNKRNLKRAPDLSGQADNPSEEEDYAGSRYADPGYADSGHADSPAEASSDDLGGFEEPRPEETAASVGSWEGRSFAQALLTAARAQQEEIAEAFVKALCEGKITLFRMMLDLEREAVAFEQEQEQAQSPTLTDYLLPLLRRDLISQKEAEREAAQAERPWETPAQAGAGSDSDQQPDSSSARPLTLDAAATGAARRPAAGSPTIEAAHGEKRKNISLSRRGLGRALRCGADSGSSGADSRCELLRAGRTADGGARHAADRPRRGGCGHGHHRGGASHAAHLRRVPQAEAFDRAGAARPGDSDRLPRRQSGTGPQAP